ncbi:MAG: MoaD family protein [Firmicutes bacterium]|nr:MoaD family protein [Bacillota bacterium]
MATVRFFATIRQLTGQKETSLRSDTVQELLQALAEKHGVGFQKAVYGPGGLSDEAIILINGRHLEHLPAGLKTKLENEDVVAIFPLVGGG